MGDAPNETIKKELDKVFSAPDTEKISKRIDNILAVYKSAAYRDLPPKYLEYLVGEFKAYVARAYADVFRHHIPNIPELVFSNESITTIVTQVWKRKIYFRIFHEGVRSMNEIKEAALYAFWILKIQPFYIPKQPEFTNKINILVALRILLNGVGAFVYGKNKKEKDAAKKYAFNFSGSMISDLYYSFKYRDWSKESLMDMGERLVIYPGGESSRAHSGRYNEEFKDRVVSEVLENSLSPSIIAYKYDVPLGELNQWVKERGGSGHFGSVHFDSAQ